MRKLIPFIILFLVILFAINQFYIINIKENNESIVTSYTPQISNTAIFTVEKIPNYIYENMLGKSIPLECKNIVDIDSLSYLQISYFGFDNETHTGEIIVNSKIANDVLEIFKELYEIKYPIEKIKLIDEYNGNDELSMSDNNTSCFCYRVISGTSKTSNHSNRYSNRYKSTI